MRKGVVDLLLTPLVFGLIVVMLWLGGTFGGMVAKESADASDKFYDQQAMGEVIDAPCAVDSRGVFYRSAVEDGDFGCLNPHSAILLKFTWSEGEHAWAVERTDSGVDVSGSPGSLENPQKYTVLIYDRDAGTKTPATLEVAAG